MMIIYQPSSLYITLMMIIIIEEKLHNPIIKIDIRLWLNSVIIIIIIIIKSIVIVEKWMQSRIVCVYASIVKINDWYIDDEINILVKMFFFSFLFIFCGPKKQKKNRNLFRSIINLSVFLRYWEKKYLNIFKFWSDYYY